jgi:hypothetical protein
MLTLAAAGAASGAGAAAAACRAGIHSVGGVKVRTYCGPASARVRQGGRLVTFQGGACKRVATVFTVSVGTVTFSRRRQFRYFRATFAGRGATFKNPIVAWQFGGRRYVLARGMLRFSGDRRRGTFSGRLARTGRFVSGSFRC